MATQLRFYLGLALLVTGCAGGAGSCVTPAPEEFPREVRVENAMSVRLTQSGFGFLNDNIEAFLAASAPDADMGIVVQPIPTSSGTSNGISYTICPGGPNLGQNPPRCGVEINFGALQLSMTPTAPHNIRVEGTIPIRIQNLPVNFVYLLVPDSTTAVLNGNNACPPAAQSWAQIPFAIELSVEVDDDPAHLRQGYSRLRVSAVEVDESVIGDSLHFCGGTLTTQVLNVVVPAIEAYVDLVATQNLDEQGGERVFCQEADSDLDPACPVGTFEVNGTCRYGETEESDCLPEILGMHGHAMLGGGALTSDPSIGSAAALEIVTAVGGLGDRGDGLSYGDLNPVAGGASMGLYGGALAAPANPCVPLPPMDAPTDIPIPAELLANTVSGWPAAVPGPHFGIGISERFVNYALHGVHQSGALCIEITSETTPQLSSGTLSLLIASLKDLGLQRESQSLAIVLKLQNPPRVSFGNGTDLASDPLVRMQLKDAAFDFMVWSSDRYIRFMTATFDLDLPMNIIVTPEGLVPVVDDIGVSNARVTEAELLREDPEIVAAALTELIAGMAGQLGGTVGDPIPLGGAGGPLGVALVIPETVEGAGSAGLRRLEQGSDGFLGIFASFVLEPMMIAPPPQPVVLIASKDVDPDGVRALTATADNAPDIVLALDRASDPHGAAIETSYRVDNGFWHPFTDAEEIALRDPALRWQGRHDVELRSRFRGQPLSLDAEPTRLQIVIDVEPPSISIGPVAEGALSITVTDLVSAPDAILTRACLDDVCGAFRPAVELASFNVEDARTIRVEARDEEGNFVSVSQALSGDREMVAGGCVCSARGGATKSGASALALALGLGLLGLRRRLR